ncbi:MAG: hypothetical protein ACLUHL_03215 [Dysosmobacter welbionis]
MKPKYLILGGLLLIAAALSLTAYNLWEDQRATATAQQALAAMEARSGSERGELTEEPEAVPAYADPEMEMPTVEMDASNILGH